MALAPYFRGTPDGVKSCPRCGLTFPHAYNAMLVRAQALGLYDGPVMGGDELCEGCDRELLVEESSLQRGLLQAGPLGLPVEFVGASWQTWEARAGAAAAVKAGRGWLSRMDAARKTAEGDLYLWGPTGVGKSRLAATLLCILHAQGWVTAFLRVPLALEWLRMGQRGDVFETYAAAGCLVLDEVGEGHRDESARASLGVLYELRRDEGLPTIWTSNLSLQELSERYADTRLTSRIAGSAELVHLTGDDQRIVKQARARADRAAKAAKKD